MSDRVRTMDDVHTEDVAKAIKSAGYTNSDDLAKELVARICEENKMPGGSSPARAAFSWLGLRYRDNIVAMLEDYNLTQPDANASDINFPEGQALHI